MPRRAGRIDSNQNQIVRDFRDNGFVVHVTSGLGDGFPDILVGGMGHLFLFEIKAKYTDKLKPKEVDFAERFFGYHVHRIHSYREGYAIMRKTLNR